MKLFFFILLFISPLISKNIYLIQSSSNIDELEAKIISQVASAFIKNPKIYISGGNLQLNSFLKKYSKVEYNCEEANFVYIKKDSNENLNISRCSVKKRVLFTDDKNIFKNNQNVIGAFYWFKSRPNIVLSSNRTKQLNMVIPTSYERFVDNP